MRREEPLPYPIEERVPIMASAPSIAQVMGAGSGTVQLLDSILRSLDFHGTSAAILVRPMHLRCPVMPCHVMLEVIPSGCIGCQRPARFTQML